MGVRTKGRRKIEYNGEQFVWYVKENDDGPGLVLHIFSVDRKFLVYYPINNLTETNQYIAVLGKRFVGAKTDGTYKRFHCPKIDHTGSATPAGVKRIIEWALTEKDDLKTYQFTGLPDGV